MNPAVGKVLAQIAATIGFALLAGLGGELAKTAGEKMRGKLKKDEEELASLKKRQAELEAELKRIREELDARRAAHPATEGDR